MENALFFSQLTSWQLSILEEKSPNVYNRLYDNYHNCLSVAEGWSTEKNDSPNEQKVFENELLDTMTMGLYNVGFQISDREEYIKTELLKKDRQASVLGGQFLGLVGSFKIGASLSQPKIGVPGGAKVPKKLPKLPRLSKAKTTPKVTTNTPKVPTATGGKTHYRLKKLSPGSEAKRFKVVVGRSRGLGSGTRTFESTPELEAHIKYRDMNARTQKGIVGAHNEVEFLKNDVRIINSTPSKSVPGVRRVDYNMPELNPKTYPAEPTGRYRTAEFKKTIYDPSVISDDAFIRRGLEAADDAVSKMPDGVLPGSWEGVDKQGVAWVGHADNNVITTFFPKD